jgi:hypothetical protein
VELTPRELGSLLGGTRGKELNLEFVYPFPKTTEIVPKQRKIARCFRKIQENLWMEIGTFGTTFVIDTLS